MKCSACNFENRSGVVFCEECGQRLDTACRQCGAVVPAGASFCPQCGVVASFGKARPGAVGGASASPNAATKPTPPQQVVLPPAPAPSPAPPPAAPPAAPPVPAAQSAAPPPRVGAMPPDLGSVQAANNTGGGGKGVAILVVVLAVLGGGFILWKQRGEQPPVSAQQQPPGPAENALPADVGLFVERAEGCLHWMGEEPYDEERRAQIESNLRELRCNELDALQAALLKKHQGDPVALNAIKEAWQVASEPSPTPAASRPEAVAQPAAITQVPQSEAARDTPSREAAQSLDALCPNQVRPEIPRKALQEGVSGTVAVEVRVSGGAVTEVNILSGPRAYHQAVRDALLRYRCIDNGQEATVRQEFEFKID